MDDHDEQFISGLAHDPVPTVGRPAPDGGETRQPPLPAGGGPASRPRRGRRALAGLAAIAVLAAGAGGGAGLLLGDTVSTAVPVSGTPVPSVVNVADTGVTPNWDAVAASVSTSVVSIIVTSSGAEDQGTGVVVNRSGDIVTNNHVVSGLGPRASVDVVVGGTHYPATVVGVDAAADLAVIRITNPPRSLTPITFANSSGVRVGDAVMAVGNPLGLAGTVTTGIVSALNRPVVTRETSSSISYGGSAAAVYTNAIQTSAPINPGNSGGPLVNASGQLIGLNFSIAALSSGSSSQSGSIGIGFAIPGNEVEHVASQLLTSGSATVATLGVGAVDGTASADGVGYLGASVTSVASGTPAASAGITRGDLVVGFNGVPVGSADALLADVRSAEAGQTVTLTIIRGGRKQTVTLTLAAAANGA